MASVPRGLTVPRASRIASLHRFDQLTAAGKNRGPERRETEQFILPGDHWLGRLLDWLGRHCLTDTRRLRLPNTDDGYGQLEKIAGDRTAFNPTRTAPVCFVRLPKPRLRREWLRKRHLLRAPAELFERRHQESAKPLGIEMGKRKIIRDQSARFLQACLSGACHIDEHGFCIGLADIERREMPHDGTTSSGINIALLAERSWYASFGRPVSPSELKSLKRSDFESEP